MDKRVGVRTMVGSAIIGLATTFILPSEHGWGSMPPMVAIGLILMIVAPFLAWFNSALLAWAAAIILLIGPALFEFSSGLFIIRAGVTMFGMILTGTAKRPAVVAAS